MTLSALIKLVTVRLAAERSQTGHLVARLRRLLVSALQAQPGIPFNLNGVEIASAAAVILDLHGRRCPVSNKNFR